MSKLKDEHQRPEGRLIEDALNKAPKKSMRRLAKDIGFSEGRVRQIVNGYQSIGGQVIPITGPTDTVARMAEAAGVTAERMREAGRPDVAEAMHPLNTVGVTEAGDLWISSGEEELAELAAWIELPEEERTPSPPIKALALWEPDELIDAAKYQYANQDRLMQHMVNVLNLRLSTKEEQELRDRIAELEAQIESRRAPRIGLVEPTTDAGDAENLDAAAKKSKVEDWPDYGQTE